jgi:hypothetical protein
MRTRRCTLVVEDIYSGILRNTRGLDGAVGIIRKRILESAAV